MITYILECLVIQLTFLLTYDLFLKRETFFQWNRIYLLATFAGSLLFPLVRFDSLKTPVPEKLVEYQEFFLQMDEVVAVGGLQESFWQTVDWGYVLYTSVALVMMFWFGIKLYHIYRLKKEGTVSLEKHYVKVVLPKSEQAFSFFRYVFLGEHLPQEKLQTIMEHEMVHVRQWHSLDLMFFELMRIIFWFNPLVYAYQNRISELHEYIADEQASKIDKKKQYELLLSRILESQSFSLVNQFFKQSLIKKRIIMLTKEKSRTIYQLKYTLLFPLVLGILMYTSCSGTENAFQVFDEQEVATGVPASERTLMSFDVIEEAPTFPGCQDAVDKRNCFKEKMQKHILENFKFPEKGSNQDFQGKVEVLFSVLKNGSIENFTDGPNKAFKDEIERVLQLLPKMEPGKQGRETMETLYKFPLSWKYHQSNDQEQNPSAKTKSLESMQVSGELDSSGKTFLGKVVSDQEPLPGVNITIKGKTEKTVSDFDGKFEVKAKKGDILIVQYVGMHTVNFVIEE